MTYQKNKNNTRTPKKVSTRVEKFLERLYEATNKLNSNSQ